MDRKIYCQISQGFERGTPVSITFITCSRLTQHESSSDSSYLWETTYLYLVVSTCTTPSAVQDIVIHFKLWRRIFWEQDHFKGVMAIKISRSNTRTSFVGFSWWMHVLNNPRNLQQLKWTWGWKPSHNSCSMHAGQWRTFMFHVQWDKNYSDFCLGTLKNRSLWIYSIKCIK